MTPILKVALIISATLSFFALPTHTLAQDDLKMSTSNQSLSPLFLCMEITSDSARLACQDVEVEKLKRATEAKTLVIFDEKSVKEIKKKSFGFSLPKLGLSELSKKSEKDNAVLLSVESIQNTGRSLTVIMENGQKWQSVDSSYGYIPRKGTFEATIKTGAFGSYVMRLSNGRVKSKKIRVRRIE